MKITFDPKKNKRNSVERSLSFERAIDFNWETAHFYDDARKPYSERRIIAVGYLEERLHVLCFTPTLEGIRVISFRKANKREVKAYAAFTLNR
jgi:uncharacterized DUF497 family protein